MSHTVTSSGPEILNIRKGAGIAGQYYYAAEVQYPGEAPAVVTFTGSTYGGPIVMTTPHGSQHFIDWRVAERCGHILSRDWVRRFFSPVA